MSVKDQISSAKTILESAELNLALAKIDVEIEKLKVQILELQHTREDYKKYGPYGAPVKNPLVAFLGSKMVTFGIGGKDEKGAELYVREKVFVAAFRDFCRENQFESVKWVSVFYSLPLTNFNVRVAKDCNKRYPNKPGAESFSGIFYMGVDIVEQTPQ